MPHEGTILSLFSEVAIPALGRTLGVAVYYLGDLALDISAMSLGSRWKRRRLRRRLATLTASERRDVLRAAWDEAKLPADRAVILEVVGTDPQGHRFHVAALESGDWLVVAAVARVWQRVSDVPDEIGRAASVLAAGDGLAARAAERVVAARPAAATRPRA